jgi:hypothetical protein
MRPAVTVLRAAAARLAVKEGAEREGLEALRFALRSKARNRRTLVHPPHAPSGVLVPAGMEGTLQRQAPWGTRGPSLRSSESFTKRADGAVLESAGRAASRLALV